MSIYATDGHAEERRFIAAAIIIFRWLRCYAFSLPLMPPLIDTLPRHAATLRFIDIFRCRYAGY